MNYREPGGGLSSLSHEYCNSSKRSLQQIEGRRDCQQWIILLPLCPVATDVIDEYYSCLFLLTNQLPQHYIHILNQTMVMLFLLCLASVFAQTPVQWQPSSYIRTGILTFIQNNVFIKPDNASASSVNIYYTPNFANTPVVILGIVTYEIDSPQLINTPSQFMVYSSLKFKDRSLIVAKINATDSRVITLRVSHFSYDQVWGADWTSSAVFEDMTSTKNISKGTGFRTLMLEYPFTQVAGVQYTMLIWIGGITIQSSSNFEVGIQIRSKDLSTLNVTVITDGDTKVWYIRFIYLIFDRAALEDNKATFADCGWTQSSKGSQASKGGILQQTNSTIIGVNRFKFSIPAQGSFNISSDYPFSLEDTLKYTYLNFTYLNIRERFCPVSSPFYYPTAQTCHNQCPQATFPNSTYSYCTDCQYTCYTCDNPSTCLTCDASSHHRKKDSGSNLCICLDGYYEDGIAVCPQCQKDCSQVVNSICVKLVYQSPKCSGCQADFLQDGSTCVLCSYLMSYCKQCSGYSLCTRCVSDDNYTLTITNNGCQCKANYFQKDSRCILCQDLMLGCLTCSSSTTCSLCDSSKGFIQVSSVCKCPDGYFYNGLTCQPCDPSCVTCSSSSANCLSCNSSNNRQLINSACACLPSYSDCRYNTCPPQRCEVLAIPTLTLKSLIKDPSSNRLIYQMQITPSFEEFKTMNFNNVIDLHLPSSTEVLIYFEDGKVFAEATYSQHVQSVSSNITLNLTNSQLGIFKTMASVNFSYDVYPSNNLAANVYDEGVYKHHGLMNIIVMTVVGLSFLAYVIGLYRSKIVATEMMCVLQAAYFGLFVLNYSDPLIESLGMLGYTNGVGVFKSAPGNISTSISSLNYSSSFFSNSTIIVAIPFVAAIVGFIFYILFKFNASLKQKMEAFYRKALGEWLLTFTLLGLLNFSASLPLFLLFLQINGLPFYLSVAEILIYLGLLGFSLIGYISKDILDKGEYSSLFRTDKFCQVYYLIPIGQRVAIGVALTVGSSTYISLIACMGIILVGAAVVIFKRPFIAKLHNIRSIVNSILTIIVFGVYTFLNIKGASQQPSLVAYLPYTIVAALLGSILMSVGMTIYELVRPKISEEGVRPIVQEQWKKQEQAQEQYMKNMYKQEDRKVAKNLFRNVKKKNKGASGPPKKDQIQSMINDSLLNKTQPPEDTSLIQDVNNTLADMPKNQNKHLLQEDQCRPEGQRLPPDEVNLQNKQMNEHELKVLKQSAQQQIGPTMQKQAKSQSGPIPSGAED